MSLKPSKVSTGKSIVAKGHISKPIRKSKKKELVENTKILSSTNDNASSSNIKTKTKSLSDKVISDCVTKKKRGVASKIGSFFSMFTGSKVLSEKQRNRGSAVTSQVVSLLVSSLEDGKMIDIRVYKCCSGYFVDFAIIATGTSTRHVAGVAEKSVLGCKRVLNIVPRLDNKMNDWVIVDVGDVVVHLMTSSKREYYKLDEKMTEIGNILVETLG